MLCIICNTRGTSTPKDVARQSPPSGSVCSTCIGQLGADVVKMRLPWTEEDLKEWGYTRILDVKKKVEEE